MKELKEGKITLDELADWFGIAASTIRAKKTKENKLKVLKTFADYHLEKRSIIIDKVHIPVYTKAYALIKEQVPKQWHKSNLDTCSRIASVIYNNFPEVNAIIKLDTAKSYTNRAKIELFGRNHLENDKGELGFSRYIWGIITENGECERLTAEQDEIVKKCASESYGNILGPKLAILNNALSAKEISLKEFYEGQKMTKVERTAAYNHFCELVTEKLGFMPDRLTEITYSAF